LALAGRVSKEVIDHLTYQILSEGPEPVDDEWEVEGFRES